MCAYCMGEREEGKEGFGSVVVVVVVVVGAGGAAA